MWPKACPKCGTGDVLLERDMYGQFIHCIQCGYTRELKESPWLVTQPQKQQESKAQPA